VFADTENKFKGQLKSVFYELKDNRDLPESERALSRLEDEGSLLITAGEYASPPQPEATSHFDITPGTESTA
jgi:hypothetical protein